MTRWLAILLCSIALACSGALAFAQGSVAVPQVLAQGLPDEGEPPAELEQVQPDMPCELPELFDYRLPALPLDAASPAPLAHVAQALSAPFIEGLQRPPRGSGIA